MTVKSKVKAATNINYRTAGSVVAGIIMFGVLVYAIRRLPDNAVTRPVKSVTEAVNV